MVGAAPCGSNVLDEIEGSNCEVLLIDPTNGDRTDVSFVQDIARAIPKVKLILVDMIDDDATFLKSVRAGAVGYILQNASALDIVAAVRSVHEGEAVCPLRFVSHFLSMWQATETPYRLSGLSRKVVSPGASSSLYR